ncbi:MAG TPA: GntR family transcriptional regulator [Burkholderiaceae bacterium]|nr:GntR family transcriptional regulator [Burkholderiaceae bacterium]
MPRGRPLTLPEQIAERITLAILNGDYGPGDRILEIEHAEQFHVSRGPIREALRILEKSGVVTIQAQRGAHVTRLAAKEVNDLFEIRQELVPLLMRSAAPFGPALVERLAQGVAELERLARDPDSWDAYTRAVMQLAQLLYRACRNEKLVEIYSSLALQTARYTKLGMRTQARRLQSARGWRRIVKALQANRPEDAARAQEELIDASRKAALAALAALEAQPGGGDGNGGHSQGS